MRVPELARGGVSGSVKVGAGDGRGVGSGDGDGDGDGALAGDGGANGAGFGNPGIPRLGVGVENGSYRILERLRELRRTKISGNPKNCGIVGIAGADDVGRGVGVGTGAELELGVPRELELDELGGCGSGTSIGGSAISGSGAGIGKSGNGRGKLCLISPKPRDSALLGMGGICRAASNSSNARSASRFCSGESTLSPVSLGQKMPAMMPPTRASTAHTGKPDGRTTSPSKIGAGERVPGMRGWVLRSPVHSQGSSHTTTGGRGAPGTDAPGNGGVPMGDRGVELGEGAVPELGIRPGGSGEELGSGGALGGGAVGVGMTGDATIGGGGELGVGEAGAAGDVGAVGCGGNEGSAGRSAAGSCASSSGVGVSGA